MFLVPQGQMGETFEPSNKEFSFGNQGEFDVKILSLFIRL
jgi:hypothetical protein